MSPLPMKSPAEVKAKLRDMLHRAQKRFIEQHRVECPENCRHAPIIGTKVQPCPKCAANPGDPCRVRLRFEQRFTYDQLVIMFKERAKNKEWVVRELRDVAMLLWVLGQLDPSQEEDPAPLPEYDSQPTTWMHLDGNTLVLSPQVTALFAAFFDKVADKMPTEGKP